jgi:hypothetical protein
MPAMGITPRQLAAVRRIERQAIRHDYLPIRKRQAELWALAHVGEDWYKLRLMLMSRGCNADYSDFTEIAPDSVYEVDDTGCYVVMADWWTDYRLCQRDGWEKPAHRQGRNGSPKKGIELYDPGEYCEDVQAGKTCLDGSSNTQCNPCMRRVENMNRR